MLKRNLKEVSLYINSLYSMCIIKNKVRSLIINSDNYENMIFIKAKKAPIND